MAEADSGTLTDAVTDLADKVDAFRTELREQRTYGEQSRKLIRRLWKVIGGVVLLAVVLIIVAIVSFRTAKLAQRNANKAVTQCEVVNNEGQRQQKLWEKVIANQPLPKTPQEAATQAAQVAQFRKDLNEAYVQQDCSKLSK